MEYAFDLAWITEIFRPRNAYTFSSVTRIEGGLRRNPEEPRLDGQKGGPQLEGMT